ncbi:hypothetical protein ACX80W_11020 [Arthrobacter sp. TMN-37]
MSDAVKGRQNPVNTGPVDGGMDWRYLRHGQPVTAEPVDGHRLPGWVDDLAEDRSMLWIQLGDGRGRRLIHCQDGITVQARRG